jgi:hypothetical protein
MILQQLFFMSEKRNDHEKFTILKRKIIHSSLSPLYIQKVAMKFIYVVEDTQMLIHANNEKKIKDRFLGAHRPVIPKTSDYIVCEFSKCILATKHSKIQNKVMDMLTPPDRLIPYIMCLTIRVRSEAYSSLSPDPASNVSTLSCL